MKRMLSFLAVVLSLFLLLSGAMAEGAEPKLVLNEGEASLAVGKSLTLKASVENPPAGKKGKPAWETSDPAVCTVSASGAVKALSEGEAVITCTMNLPEGGILSAQCRVKTYVAATQLKAGSKNLTLHVGETAAAEYTLLPENVTEKALSWSSSDGAVASVDVEGKITAVAPGTAKITAETKDGSKKKAIFTVYVPTLSAAQTEYTLSDVQGLDIPVSWYGTDYEKNISVKVSGTPVRMAARQEENRIVLHLDALEAGDSKIEVTDKKDKKAKLAFTVHTEESAVWNSLLVEFTSVQIQWNNGLLLNLGAVNHSNRKVAGIHYFVDFRTASGESVFFPKIFDGAVVQSVAHYFDAFTSKNPWEINPRSTGKHRTYLTPGGKNITNREIAEVRCAIANIIYEDGSSVWIPDSQLYWFSSETGYLEAPAVKANYVPLPQEIRDKAGTISLGIYTTRLYSFLLPWYGFPFTGLYVTNVEQGSLAEQCGIRLKDLIYEVDGIAYAEDGDCLTRGKAKMADGETVVFKVLRDGEPIEIEMSLPASAP